jgi:hypothetical protein
MITALAMAMVCLLLFAKTAFPQSAGKEETNIAGPQQQCQKSSLGQVLPDISGPASCLISPDRKQTQPLSREDQTKRMFWVVPNFAAVGTGQQLPPLSAHDKFVLATHDSVDYSGFTWTAILAAQSYALNADSELGRGAAGYGRYFWRTFADGVSGSYFTEAIVPAITREDPRYYTLGHGGFFRRSGYSLSRVVLTKTDSGGTSFNWSEVGGNAVVAALSNAYYPPQERGFHQTFRDWGAQIESAALNNIVKEFWPDIRHKLLRQK